MDRGAWWTTSPRGHTESKIIEKIIFSLSGRGAASSEAGHYVDIITKAMKIKTKKEFPSWTNNWLFCNTQELTVATGEGNFFHNNSRCNCWWYF